MSLDYHRLVVAYHGCDKGVAEMVLSGNGSLENSYNDDDWLGHGLYFWEHGKDRALDWAVKKQKRDGSIKCPDVIGAYIHLGNCFDLLDTKHTLALGQAYKGFKKWYLRQGKRLPTNEPAYTNDDYRIRRKLDCAVINWHTTSTDKLSSPILYQTIRACFQEGAPAYEGSEIRSQSHIQLCVRDKSCVLGYFRPS